MNSHEPHPLIPMWQRGIEKMQARLAIDPDDKTAAFFIRAYEGYIKQHTPTDTPKETS